MKKIKLLVFIFPFLFSFSFAEVTYYTVVAKSGLSLREEMNINSKKIDVAPFKAQVEVYGLHREEKLIVENVEGFWVHAKFGDKTGYMFSGYLFPGNFFYPEIRTPKPTYATLDEFGPDFLPGENGNYELLNFIYFDNYENWYGIKIDEFETTLTKISINYKIIPQRIQPYYDSLGNNEEFYWDFSKPLPIDFEITPLDTFDFFVGSDSNLSPKSSSFVYFKESNEEFGKFLYPWQTLAINNTNYYIEAKGEINETTGQDLKQEIIYSFTLNNSITNTIINIPTSYESINTNIDFHVDSKSPKIIWSGDINNDKIPDLIIEPSITFEGCIEVSNLLLISFLDEKNNIKLVPSGGINFNSINR